MKTWMDYSLRLFESGRHPSAAPLSFPPHSPNFFVPHLIFSRAPCSLIPELFHTEKSHVRNLKALDRFFHQPLSAAVKQPLTPAHAHNSGGSGAGAQAGLPKDFVDSLFPNLGDVIAWHDKANQRMKETVKKHGFPIGKIGSILSDMVSSDHCVHVHF